MRCMHRGPVVGREILPDKSLGKRVVVNGAACPHDATHEVVVDGRYLGSYCEAHDHPSRSVRSLPRKKLVSFWVHDVHTGDRVGQATAKVRAGHEIGVPFEVFDAGVKRVLVIRAYETTHTGRPVR